MSECTAGPPLAPLQLWLWQNSSWVKVTAEIPLIVPKHPSESCIAVGRSRERPREVTVQHSGGPLGLTGTNQCFRNVMSLWLLGSGGRVFEFVVFASLGSNTKLCFALTYCPHHVAYVYAYLKVCTCVCLCVCVHCARWRTCTHGCCLYALL